MTAGQ